jgi:branched-chain amino acid transport system ATP-binding protein
MLTVTDIDVSYGDLQALWDVSLKVEKGEIVSIVGSNGAGKTTTLKTISGLLKAKRGTINFLGQDIEKMPPHNIVDLGIAQIPEGRRLFPLFSVLENLKMGAYTRRAYSKRNETIDWVFQLFPVLKERKDQPAGTLSGGEQQMLAVARGLMSKPTLLMLDEPSLGLAPMMVLSVFQMVEKINSEGITILLVEQNVRHTLELTDRAYVLETGRITLEGTGKELMDNQHVKKAYLGM